MLMRPWFSVPLLNVLQFAQSSSLKYVDDSDYEQVNFSLPLGTISQAEIYRELQRSPSLVLAKVLQNDGNENWKRFAHGEHSCNYT